MSLPFLAHQKTQSFKMQQRIKEIKHFLIKEWRVEYQQSHIFFSTLIYVFATVFLLYVTLGKPDDAVWNALFWVTQIFVILNAVSKSFLAERQESLNFFYVFVAPQQFILAKLFYNVALVIVFTCINFFIFLFFLGVPEIPLLPYLLLSVFGGIGFSNIFTFLSAVSAKAKQNAAFVAILGFPLVIPQIMLIDKLTDSIFSKDITNTFLITLSLLILLDVLNILLAVILYPFLWKE